MVDNIFDTAYAGQNALHNPTINPSERLINIVDDTGKGIGSVPESQLPAYIKKGYHIESEAQKKLNDYIEDNSGTTGALKTAALSAANEATFGIGKELIKAGLSDEEAKELDAKYEGLRSANPLAAGLGTGAGFAGSMFLGGPIFKGAAKLGQLAEGAVTAGRAAEGLGLGTKLLSKAAGGFAENAAVGTALSAPEVINQLRQGNPQEAAEAVLINAGLGGLLGSAFGAAGLGAKAGLSKLAGSDSLEKLSTDQTIRSLTHSTDQVSLKLINALENKGVSKKELANYVKENNLFRKLTGSYEDDVIPKLDELKSAIGKQIGAKQDALLINGVDGPSMNELFGKIQLEVIDPLMANGATRPKARQLQNQLKDFAESMSDSQQQRALKEGLNLTALELENKPLSLAVLNNERKALDPLIHAARQAAKFGDLNAMEKELNNVRSIFKDTVDTYGEKALGETWRKELGALNKEYQIISTLSEVAERSSIVEQKNQQFALKDLIASGAAFAGGNVASGILAPIGMKVLRKKGNEWLAKAADYTNNSMINAANQMVDDKLSVIPKILNNTISTAGVQAGGNSLHRLLNDIGITSDDNDKNKDIAAFNTLSNHLAAQARMPDNHITAIAKAVNPNDPNTAMALNQSGSNVLNYLYNQMPKAPTGPVPFQASWQPTPQQLKAFTSQVAVAADPFVVLDKLGDGSLNQNHVQALKALYPSIYTKLVDQIKQEGMKKNAAKLPYSKKIQLSLLLGEKLDPSLNNVQSLQASYQQQGKEKPMAEGKLENVPGSEPTEMQKVQNDLPA